MVLFRNRIAAFLWGFSAVFATFVALMTYVLARDGVPEGTSPLLMHSVMAVFAVVAVALCSWAARHPLVTVRVFPDGRLRLTRRWPHRADVRELTASGIHTVAVIEDKDSEGDPYFRCRMELNDGLRIDVAEGHSREACVEAMRRLESAVHGT